MVTVVIGGNLIDLMSTKITWKKPEGHEAETQATRQTFKGSLVLKLNLPWNTEVTLCHFSPSTCCPTVVRCQGDFYSRTFHVISFHGDCVQTSCQYVLPSAISLVEKGEFLSWPDYTCCVCSVESQFPIIFFTLHRPYLSAKGRPSGEHTSSVSASPCFTFTQSHTLLSWEPPSITKATVQLHWSRWD